MPGCRPSVTNKPCAPGARLFLEAVSRNGMTYPLGQGSALGPGRMLAWKNKEGRPKSEQCEETGLQPERSRGVRSDHQLVSDDRMKVQRHCGRKLINS